MQGKDRRWLILLFLPFLSFAQLTVTPSAAANTLAQTIAGNGVTVSNAAINCGAGASGTFTYAGANLGIPSGIILTTGAAADAANPGTFFTSVLNGNMVNDPDLTAIEPLATNDVCILEFDFMPICNNISITFVFGSEEYPAFVNSTFNDGFGIFLTGPNPGGGNYTATNVGTLPNGTPVSINNVHAGLNSTYFVDNYTSPNNDIVYDGYTVPITSVTQVVPCSTYHMKIAIADAGDQAYDSGVFIGSNAVSCQNAPAVTATATPDGCGGNTGSATATVTNYTGAVTYQWQPGGQTTATAGNLAPGTYTCNVGLQLSCGTITQTVTAVVASTGVNLNVNATATNPLCNGGSNGTATVTVSGGTAPYTYSWSTTPAQTTTTASGLAAGQYVITVTDNGGCNGSATVTLTNPAPLVATVTTTPSQCSANNGTAGANVTSGGTAPFSYAWTSTPMQTTQVATNLAPGTYSVLIMDVNTCTVTSTANITLQNGGWTLTAGTPTNVSCFNGSDGSATFTINNPGANVFTYSWNTSPAQATQVANNIPAGSFTCAVSDNNGCTQTVSVTVTQPTQLTASTQSSPTKCTALIGSANAVVSGGTAPYTYSWGTSPVQTTSSASGLGQGTYSVTVTDSKGCSVTTVANITTSNGLPLTISATADICNSSIGSATVTPNGNPPYTYLWNTSPAVSTQALSNVPAGSYFVTVTDIYGCTDGIQVAVDNVNETLNSSLYLYPDELYAGEQITITVVTNSGWSLNSATLSEGNLTFSTNSLIHTFQQQGLYYASYFFTSANGCQDSVVYPIKVNDFMTLYFPNAFSPNGDGLNDIFKGQGTFIKSFEMMIYDRWGNLVMKTNELEKGWNGNYKGDEAPQDTYVYKGKVTDIFGKVKLFTGQVQLVR